MTRDLAALARTLDALRALHGCPLCHASGDVLNGYGDTVCCLECGGSGIAAPRTEDDVVSQMSRAAQSIDRVVDADVAALRDRLDAAEKAIAGLEARAIEAERESARAWCELDRLRALTAGVDVTPSPELVAAGERGSA